MSFDFYEELHSSKLSQDDLRLLCGVSERTMQRWVKDNTCPVYAQTIIKCYSYDMSWIGKAWKGSYIDTKDYKLWLNGCPRPFSVGDILVLRHEWPKLHWYYENWIRSENHPGWTHDPDPDVIQFDLPLKLKKTVNG